MAKNYRDVNYWESKPEVVKIFDDLEKFHDYCRFELAPFDEANLYNRDSWVWRNYEKTLRPRKFNGDRKPYQGKRYNGERFSN
jgi:hypothetical protein